MMVASSRISKFVDRTGLVITVRGHRQIVSVIFISIWLVLWFVGGGFAGNALLQDWQAENPDRYFMSLWMIAWAIAALATIKQLLWRLWGKEKLIISNQSILYRWSIPLWRRSRRFKVQEIRSIIWEKTQTHRPDHTFLSGPPEGSIKVNLITDQVTLLDNIDKEEAALIMKEIKRIARISFVL